jgi:hypothetical protein
METKESKETKNTQNNGQTEKHVDSTIEAINEHVEKKNTSVATSIGSWIKTLESHKEFKTIASDLEKLKEALSAKDGKKIVDLMTKLGEETTKAAEEAEGGEGKKIKMLGKAISAGAKAISKII